MTASTSFASVKTLHDPKADPAVRGFLHTPAEPRGDGLVLTHGAGGNAKMQMLVALADAFAGAGFVVLRCDLPFRQARPFGPPRPAEAVRDRAGVGNAVAAMRKLVPGRVFAGGQSYGGRQATMLCAEQAGLADGLLLTSYPLHPPGKPGQLRTEHFPRLQAPALFVEGTSDAFATVEEIRTALRLIPARTRVLTIEGAGHDLGFRGKKQPQDFGARVLQAFRELFG